MNDVDLRLRLEQFSGKMCGKAVAGRREVKLSGISLGERNELAERMRRHVDIHHQDIGLRADQADRRKILLRIEADLAVEASIGGEDGVVAQQQRVTVRRGMSHHFAGDIAAGTRTIIDDKRLPEQAAEFVGQNTGKDVARAAGRKTDDERNGPGRVIGCHTDGHRANQREQCGRGTGPFFEHCHSP